MEDEELLTKWMEENSGEELCNYCNISEECPRTMVCYGGEPIEPPCIGADVEYMKQLLDTESILDDIHGGNIDVKK